MVNFNFYKSLILQKVLKCLGQNRNSTPLNRFIEYQDSNDGVIYIVSVTYPVNRSAERLWYFQNENAISGFRYSISKEILEAFGYSKFSK